MASSPPMYSFQVAPRHSRAGCVFSSMLSIAVAVVVVIGAHRISTPVPVPAVEISVPVAQVISPGVPPPISLPDAGQLALDSDIDGRVAARAEDVPRPIASIAKTMTAVVVLEAHPLAPGAEGALLTMTQQDVDLYSAALAEGGSSFPVAAGEQLSERQLLLGLMLPSANNFAETLALWVGGGDRAAFIRRLNDRARSLGMDHTHFEDPSGYSPLTVSTAAALVLLGRAALANPALAAIVVTPQATLPRNTVVANLDYLVGVQPGWLGIKTGDTPSAGSCLLFAAREDLADAHTQVTLIGAVLGQPNRDAALRSAALMVTSAARQYSIADLASTPPALAGQISTRWGDGAPVVRGVVGPHPTVVRLGSPITLVPHPGRISLPLRAGDSIGVVTEVSGPRHLLDWPVIAGGDVSGPSLAWRLLNG